MPLPWSTIEERLDRSIAALSRSDWTSWDAIAAFRSNTRLFVRGDVVFCDFINGGGERCIICGSSSKRGVLGLKRGGTIYASYARSRYDGGSDWSDYRNRAQLTLLGFARRTERRLGDLTAPILALPDTRVRALVLDRYAQRVPQPPVSADSRHF